MRWHRFDHISIEVHGKTFPRISVGIVPYKAISARCISSHSARHTLQIAQLSQGHSAQSAVQTFFGAGQAPRQPAGELPFPWLPLEPKWTLNACKHSLTWWSSKHWHICLALFFWGLHWLLWVEHELCVRVCSAQSHCSVRRTSPLVGAALLGFLSHTAWSPGE